MGAPGWALTGGAMALAALVALAQFWDDETLHGPYLLDDRGTVRENPCVKPEVPDSWERLWTYDYWGHNKLTDPQSHKSFRPITTLTYRWNYMVHGLDTFGYRVTNVALHAAVCGLAVLAVGRSTVHAGRAEALAAALVFAVHPVHAEAVSNVTGRAEVLMSLLYILGFLCYTTAHVRQPNGVWRPSTVLRFALAYTSLMGFTLLSLLSKEHGITLPVLCAGWDALIPSGLNVRGLLGGWMHNSEDTRRRWWGWLRRTVVLAISTLGLAYWRLSLNVLMDWHMRRGIGGAGESLPHFIKEQNPAAYEKHALSRGLSYSWLYIRNLGLLVFPHQLCPDWTGGAIPTLKVEELGQDWRVGPICLLYLSFVLWLVWIGLPPAEVRDSDDKHLKAAAEAVERVKRDSVLTMAWLIIPFIMSMNIITVVGFVMADRVLYLSTLGWAMWLVNTPRAVHTFLTIHSTYASATPATAASAAVPTTPDADADADATGPDPTDDACEGETAPEGEAPPPAPLPPQVSRLPSTAVALSVLLATAAYSYTCYYQNRNWRSEFALWESAWKVNPIGHIVQSEYGKSLANIGRYSEAIGVLEAALRSAPDQLTLMGSLGLSFVYTGKCKEALPLFEKGLAFSLSGRGMGDALQADNPANTPEKSASMAAIFYVGFSMCAPTLEKMGNLIMIALQTHPTSEFALENAQKVNHFYAEVQKQGLHPRQVLVEHSQGPDGKRSMAFKIMDDPDEYLAQHPELISGIWASDNPAAALGGRSPAANSSPSSSAGKPSKPAKKQGKKGPKKARKKFGDPALDALLFKIERMRVDF